ncbi:hypothetical protein JW868_03585 [Candidatus Woesearchaeota archaeon]|nr:hypothetical protein [Candidatus Woesearchaeota archaeon]
MSEVTTLIDGRPIHYEGLMKPKELLKNVQEWFYKMGYDWLESKNWEEIYEDGKQLTVEIYPYKKVSDYYKYEIRIFFLFSQLREVEVEHHGVKHKYYRGKLKITMDCFLITDWEGKWDLNAKYYLFRTILDKFIYRKRSHMYEQKCYRECLEIEEEIKSYLNLYKYTVPRTPTVLPTIVHMPGGSRGSNK